MPRKPRGLGQKPQLQVSRQRHIRRQFFVLLNRAYGFFKNLADGGNDETTSPEFSTIRQSVPFRPIFAEF
jgi:hypothetical protein